MNVDATVLRGSRGPSLAEELVDEVLCLGAFHPVMCWAEQLVLCVLFSPVQDVGFLGGADASGEYLFDVDLLHTILVGVLDRDIQSCQPYSFPCEEVYALDAEDVVGIVTENLVLSDAWIPWSWIMQCGTAHLGILAADVEGGHSSRDCHCKGRWGYLVLV